MLINKWIELVEKPLNPLTVVENKYMITEILGKGSYGFTYLVEDEQKNQKVLKQLRKYKRLDHAGSMAFDREAFILSDFKHPAFPQFHENFEDKNQKRFIVMEYKKGKTYEQLIFDDGVRYTEKESLKELYDVLMLVKIIHEKGYIHRDLRIPNILKHENTHYIIDFGLARKSTDRVEKEEKLKRLDKKLFREISYKSDFYALGHFLLFLLYSSYEPESSKKKTWEDELRISNQCKMILRKMLQLDEPYEEVTQVIHDVKKCLH
ncbi:serine/threonine protein kinase [Metabacillus schmidteae]|uniref:serine/threonine protein kinase n=1 Tax=Metabacillus schmidteae TaxID=2730405 RepID=UPI001F2256FB|nr:protein kinase family protein [Metabacillus schmidteae]